MKVTLFFFCSLLLFSCAGTEKISQGKIQKALFDTTFNYADVKAVDIVEIEHPMLGGLSVRKRWISNSARRL